MQHLAAEDVYLKIEADIIQKMVQLEHRVANHYPDGELHWGHVGDLQRVERLLDDAIATFEVEA